MTNENGKFTVYILAGTVGALSGAFGMMIFMFGIVTTQATLLERSESHLLEWRSFHNAELLIRAEELRERKAMLKMIYEIKRRLK